MKLKGSRTARAALIVLALGSYARGVSANPADVFGLGSRSSALAGAVSADVSDFSACYYNPAGLLQARGVDLSLGYMWARSSLAINGNDSHIDPVHGVAGGAVAPGRIWTVPVAFGVAAHVSDDRLARVRTFRIDEPRWVLYDNRPQLLFLSANLGFRVTDYLSFGGGINFLAATRGAIDISGTLVLPSGSRTEYDSDLRHRVDADLSSVRYPDFGMLFTPSDRLKMALVYRGQAQVKLDIRAVIGGEVDASLLSIPIRYELESITVNNFIPAQHVLGVSTEPVRHLRANLDLAWVHWSDYQSPVSRSSTHLSIKIPTGFPIELPEEPKPSVSVDPNFQDRIVPRIGIEYRLPVVDGFELPLRGGYAYEKSPVPAQTGITNYVDADRHLISAGFGFIWHEPTEIIPGDLRWDAHAEWAVLPTRVTVKDNPADFTGDYSARGSQWALGTELSVGFR